VPFVISIEFADNVFLKRVFKLLKEIFLPSEGINICKKKENEMDGKEGLEKNSDSVADSISAILIILIPVVAIIYWLSGLPTS